jgi:hypothetical protein
MFSASLASAALYLDKESKMKTWPHLRVYQKVKGAALLNYQEIQNSI